MFTNIDTFLLSYFSNFNIVLGIVELLTLKMRKMFISPYLYVYVSCYIPYDDKHAISERTG